MCSDAFPAPSFLNIYRPFPRFSLKSMMCVIFRLEVLNFNVLGKQFWFMLFQLPRVKVNHIHCLHFKVHIIYYELQLL